MPESKLAARVRIHLDYLCSTLPTRTVGTQGNRDASAYFAASCRQAGWTVEEQAFECMDWNESGVDLRARSASFTAYASPYSLGVALSAPLVIASTVEELEALEMAGKILLLRGELTREQLAPKNFPWWNPEEHQRIIAALERGAPGAILAATTQNPELAGAVYPFPLIEDGDFNISSAYLTADEGEALAAHAGETIFVEIRADRTPAQGTNIVARKGEARDAGSRYLVSAHIDAKRGTPGAIDNATGTIVLLLLAELLASYEGEKAIELVAFNGEDYYSAPGEQVYLQENPDMSSVALVINIDGAGYCQGDTHYSLYNCEGESASRICKGLEAYGLVEGAQWYQSDHSIFVMAGRPAVAITSETFGDLMSQITHTPKDAPAIVDPAKVAQIAYALHGLLTAL